MLKGRCGLPVRTAWKQFWWCSKAAAGCSPHRSALCSKAAAGCQPAPLEAALVLKSRCGLPARTAWKQLSKAAAGCQAPLAAAGCQPAPLGSSFGAQRPLRTASPHRSAPLGSSFGAQKPLRAASPHRLQAALVLKGRLQAALVLKGRCGLPARTACKQLWCSKAAAGCQPAPLEAALVLKGRCGLPARTAWKQLWCSKAAAGCQPAPLGSSFGAQRPLRVAALPARTAAAPLQGCQLWCSKATLPLRAASPHRLQAALVLKGRCRRLPARTAWKQLWCSKAAAGCQPAPLGSSFGAQRPLRAASPHRLEAALVLKGRCELPARTAWKQLWCSKPCGLPARTAWKQLWCSKAAAGCQPAPLASSFGAQRPLRAASPHRLEAALVLKGRCGLPARTAWKQLWCSKPLRAASPHRLKQLWCSKAAAGCQPAPLWKQLWCSKAAAGCQPAPLWCSTATAGCQQLGATLVGSKPLRAASPHRLEAALVLKGRCGLPARTACQAALVLKGRCGLPARTAWKQFGAQPLRAASPHRLEAALVLKGRCGLPARTAWKQLWCSKPLRAASPHRLEAALVLKGRCGLPARTKAASKPSPQLWCSKLPLQGGCQPAPL